MRCSFRIAQAGSFFRSDNCCGVRHDRGRYVLRSLTNSHEGHEKNDANKNMTKVHFSPEFRGEVDDYVNDEGRPREREAGHGGEDKTPTHRSLI